MLSFTPNGNVTLQAVAAKAGVSTSTASRCLTGAVTMAAATRARVVAAADALGYRHNPLLGEVMRSTRRASSSAFLGTLAYITPSDEKEVWRSTPTLCRHWSAARAHAVKLGFGMAEFSLTSCGMTGKRLGEILVARGITGILLAAFPNDPFEIVLPWERFATVPVGHMLPDPQLDCVVSNHTESVLMVGRVLAARGYRRIGLAVESYQNRITNRAWATGFTALATQIPGVVPVPAFLPETMNARDFLEWVKAHRVDCVLTLSTFRNMPNRMREWLGSAGVDCPRDLGLVSLDASTTTNPDWAGVDQNADDIGKGAVDLLLSKICAGERGIPKNRRSLLIHSHWREGETVRSALLSKPAA